jgi:hypothetical protein
MASESAHAQDDVDVGEHEAARDEQRRIAGQRAGPAQLGDGSSRKGTGAVKNDASPAEADSELAAAAAADVDDDENDDDDDDDDDDEDGDDSSSSENTSESESEREGEGEAVDATVDDKVRASTSTTVCFLVANSKADTHFSRVCECARA